MKALIAASAAAVIAPSQAAFAQINPTRHVCIRSHDRRLRLQCMVRLGPPDLRRDRQPKSPAETVPRFSTAAQVPSWGSTYLSRFPERKSRAARHSVQASAHHHLRAPSALATPAIADALTGALPSFTDRREDLRFSRPTSPELRSRWHRKGVRARLASRNPKS